jgi:hypothetical protein
MNELELAKAKASAAYNAAADYFDHPVSGQSASQSAQAVSVGREATFPNGLHYECTDAVAASLAGRNC